MKKIPVVISIGFDWLKDITIYKMKQLSYILKYVTLSLILAAASSERRDPLAIATEVFQTYRLSTQSCSFLPDCYRYDGHEKNFNFSSPPSQKVTSIGQSRTRNLLQTLQIRAGASWLPAGYHPYGYGLTELGLEFLKFEGSLDSDIGRFLASLKTGRKKQKVLKEQWIEVVRVSKTGQSMRILRTLDDLIAFCVKVGFID